MIFYVQKFVITVIIKTIKRTSQFPMTCFENYIIWRLSFLKTLKIFQQFEIVNKPHLMFQIVLNYLNKKNK